MAGMPRPREGLVCELCKATGVPALQRCARCDRRLCQECYAPWEGLVCPLCRHPAGGRPRLRVVGS